jgi:alcohol dehydrogenase (cytochrome c)
LAPSIAEPPRSTTAKLFRVTVDNHLIALDMKTGKVIWNQTFADFREGYTSTGAPIVANGVADLGHGRGRVHHARFS